MKTFIHSQLKSLGHTPHPRAIAKMELIREKITTGNLPPTLHRKCEALFVNLPKCDLARKLHDLTRLIFCLPVQNHEASSLTLYALAYLWEENDSIVDDCERGLDDDRHIICHIHRILKPNIDECHLRLARPNIQDAWLRSNP